MRAVVVGRWLPTGHRGTPLRGTPAEFEDACRQIGRSLAAHGHTLAVTSDAEFTADRAAVEGYVDAVRNSSNSRHRIELVSKAGLARELFPSYRKAFPALFSTTPMNTSGMEVARLRVTIEADATILIAGGSGTERTAYVAMAARRKGSPLPRSVVPRPPYSPNSEVGSPPAGACPGPAPVAQCRCSLPRLVEQNRWSRRPLATAVCSNRTRLQFFSSRKHLVRFEASSSDRTRRGTQQGYAARYGEGDLLRRWRSEGGPHEYANRP